MINPRNRLAIETAAPAATDEGGLRAPPGLTGWRKAWWWFDFIILVKLARLRFVAVLIVIGLVITQWDLLNAYYQKWTRSADAEVAAGDVEWFCPMHPSIVRDNSKEKCPICFMPLSKRKKGHEHAEALPGGVVSRVQLSPYRVVLAGVQTWRLDYVPVRKQIKAVGFVEFNERGQRTVSARIAGRIDKLFANETGQMVEKGAPLATIYSPELVITIQNLLDAKRGGAAKNQESAQRRLELLGIDGAQVQEILQSGAGRTDLTIHSPISGHVIKKYVREGQYVEQGGPLYDVADLSSVWIQAQIYEDDMEFLPLDQTHPDQLAKSDAIEVTATTRAFPNEEFRGKLAFIYPHVDPATRTLTIRCELANPGHKLRPGSTATLVLNVEPRSLHLLQTATADNPEDSQELEQGRVLAVPDSAVVETGEQSIVYREEAPGVFEGVKVRLGPRMTGPDGATVFPVLSGLTRDERVVVSGSFLVDAETRLNAAVGSIYFGGSGGGKNQAGAAVTRPSTPDDPDPLLAAALAKLSSEDRKLVDAQQFCPVLPQNKLGSMGPPVKLTLQGKPVFICCEGCKEDALADPAKTLAKLTQRDKDSRTASQKRAAAAPDDEEEAEITASLAKLSAEDRKIAEQQKFCVILSDNRLGSMGTPVKLTIEGQTVFVCCEACKKKALANPRTSLEKRAKLRAQHAQPTETEK